VIRRLQLFFEIVWRERADGKRMGIRQAWEVARAFYGRRHEEMP